LSNNKPNLLRGKEHLLVESIDHLVLTVSSIEDSVDFYIRVLGMEAIEFGEGRTALKFGRSKINLHGPDDQIFPRAHIPTPGSADVCLITQWAIQQVVEHLEQQGVDIEIGPDTRTGAMGPITSVYIRDPDQNLIEISSYEQK